MIELYCRLLLLAFPRAVRDRVGRPLVQTMLSDCRRANGRLSPRGLLLNSIDIVRAGLGERVRPSPQPAADGWRHGNPHPSLSTDFHHARRSLARRPVFAFTVFATLALGLGLNTAIFSIVNRVLVTELPYRDPSRLGFMWSKLAWVGVPRAWVAGPHIDRLRREAPSVESILPIRTSDMALVGAGAPDLVSVGLTTAPLFDVLGVPILHGRGFVVADEPLNVAILTYPVWRQRFGSDPGVIGRKVELGGDAMEIIGVLPEDCRFLVHSSLGNPKPIDIWVPTSWPLATMSDANFGFAALVRVKPTATLAQAQAELDVIGARIDKERFKSRGFGWQLIGVQQDLVKEARPALLLILGAAGVVLLVVCATVTGLLLVRHADRRREFAVRTAMGAGRGDIVRLVVIECVALSIGAGIAGTVLAAIALQLVVAANTLPIPRLAEVTIDWKVLAFTFALSIASGLAASVIPAWRFTRTQASIALGNAARGSSARTGRARATLVAAELALAVVLVVGSALLVRSYTALRRADPGFNGSGTLASDIRLLQQRYPQEAQAVDFFTRLTESIRSSPEVVAVGAVTSAPLDANTDQANATPAGWVPPAGGPAAIMVDLLESTPGYFPAMGVSMLAGRDFAWTDRAGGERVAIVDETFVRQAWPDGNALGKSLKLDVTKEQPMVVVGVVRHARQYKLDADDRPQVYLPYSQFTANTQLRLAVRTNGDPERLTAVVTRAVRAIDEKQPVANIATMQHAVDHAVADRRLQFEALSAFAIGAAVLAALGLHGLLASLVAERRREIGIRMALGADRGAVRRMIGRHIVIVTGAGLATGLVAALAASRLMAPFLYGISPRDPIAIAGTVVALVGVTVVVSYWPVRRATSVDPADALRRD